MKGHLVNLLYEEYKQVKLCDELEEKGIDMNNIIVNNSNIVFDIIGFPKEGLVVGEKLMSLNRDWLHDKFYDIIKDVDNNEVKKKLSNYVDWLYQQYSSSQE